MQKQLLWSLSQMQKQNVVLIEINLFDQPVKNEERTYINIPKITNGQWDDCTAGCQLDYPYFK